MRLNMPAYLDDQVQATLAALAKVTHDSGTVSGMVRHNVRWEKYVRFCMPDEILFGNRILGVAFVGSAGLLPLVAKIEK